MSELMSTEEVLSEATKLARRFRGFSSQEDLIQEGLLAYYETTANGVDDKNRVITQMRKAMYSFANYHSNPVKIPAGGDTYRLNKELPPEEYEKLSQRDKELYQALRNVTTDTSELESYFSTGEIDIDTRLALKEGFGSLKKREQEVLFCTVIEGMKASEAASVLGYSGQRTREIKAEALEKLKTLMG